MMCPRLSGRSAKLCAAVEGLVVLSSGELEAFCVGGNYPDCPVYQARQLLGRKISLGDYSSISSLKHGPAWSQLSGARL